MLQSLFSELRGATGRLSAPLAKVSRACLALVALVASMATLPARHSPPRPLTESELDGTRGLTCSTGCELSPGVNCVPGENDPACDGCHYSMSKLSVPACTTPYRSFSGVQTAFCVTNPPANCKQCQKGNTRCWTEYNCNDSGLLVDVSCSNGSPQTCTVVDDGMYCRTCTVGTATGNFQDYENDACI